MPGAGAGTPPMLTGSSARPSRFAARRLRAWSTRTRRIIRAAIPKKCARFSQCTPRCGTSRIYASLTTAVGCSVWPARSPRRSARTELDAFMKDVLARRDDNWKKLQQYILDEREQIDLRGPNRQPMWGEERDYTWYIRDGYFVRSPVKFNGVTIGDDDRRKYEAEFLERQKRREKRQQQRERESAGDIAPQPPSADPPTVDSLILQTRQPQFI